MTKVVLDVDERTLNRVATVARARSVSVESVIVACMAEIASLAPIEIENPSHRAMLATLERPLAPGESERDALHDRERARAEVYVENRRKLLALVDATEGDRGGRVFDRAALYEC